MRRAIFQEAMTPALPLRVFFTRVSKRLTSINASRAVWLILSKPALTAFRASAWEIPLFWTAPCPAAYSDRIAATGLTDTAPLAEGRLARRDTPTAMATATT